MNTLGEEILQDKHYLYAKRAYRKIKIMHCWGHKLLHYISSSYIQWEVVTESIEGPFRQNRKDQTNIEVNVLMNYYLI